MSYLFRKHFFENEDAKGSSESTDKEDSSSLEYEDELDEAIPETLFAKNEGGIKEKKKKRHGMVKLQKIMIASFLSLAVVFGVLYAVWLGPMMKELQTEEPTVPAELIEGEAYDDSGYDIAIFKHIQIKEIKSIVVHNSYESFTCLKYDGKEEEFYIKEHPKSPVDTELFVSFAVAAGYPVVNRRVTASCEDFSLYGLADEDDPAYYTITDVSGKEHTVYIGDLIPSGGGFYARYKGRDALYVLPYDSANLLLAPSTSVMSTTLGYPIDQDSAQTMDEFMINKNGQTFVYITYNENVSDETVLSAFNMMYPANYLVNDTSYSSVVIGSLLELEGYQVLVAGSEDRLLIDDEAVMMEYGFFDIQNAPYELYYAVDGSVPTVIAFAPSGIDGYYFAYSYLYDIIVLIETETVEYLDWDILQYIDSAIFAENILKVEEITVTGGLRYDGNTYEISERFSIGTGDDNKLLCYAYSTGRTFTGNRPANNTIQAFYGTVLYMDIDGYIKSESIDISKLTEYASMTVKTDDGRSTVYKFYRYSERCYYTINGEGEFYLSLQEVNKLLIDAVRAAHGEYVDETEEYPKLPIAYIESYKEKAE